MRGDPKYLHAAIRVLLIGAALCVVLYIIGCAGNPVRNLEVFTVDRVTVFCADEDFIKQYYVDCGGDREIKDRVHSIVDGFRHIYTPCVEIDGLILPADQNALGHELWHVINMTHPKRTMNPDDWRAR